MKNKEQRPDPQPLPPHISKSERRRGFLERTCSLEFAKRLGSKLECRRHRESARNPQPGMGTAGVTATGVDELTVRSRVQGSEDKNGALRSSSIYRVDTWGPVQ